MTERRTRLLFIALVVGQLLLISARAPTESGEQTVLARVWLRTVAPFAHAVDAVVDGVADLSVYWSTRNRLLTDNAGLRAENEVLRQQAVEHLGLASDLQRLSLALYYARSSSATLLVADVIYVDHTSWMRTLLVRLSRDGAVPNQPVITASGLVGRVIGVSGRYAKVQLVIDRAASVGVMVERTRRQGVVRGSHDERLALELIPLQSDLEVGDRIVTAGIDGVYPRGLPVGVVSSVEPGRELFYEVEVAPAVDFGTVDHVYILESESLPAELLESTDEPAEARP